MTDSANYIGQPIRSLQTMLRAIAHTDSRIPPLVPDGIYGVNTTAAVREFQRQYDLPVTGQTDNATWNQIVAVFTLSSPSVLPAEPLHIRWTPNRALALQRYFANAPELSVTGVHDESSVAAVRWLQTLSGLPATGEIDQTTWAYLTGLYALTTGDGDFSMPETVSH